MSLVVFGRQQHAVFLLGRESNIIAASVTSFGWCRSETVFVRVYEHISNIQRTSTPYEKQTKMDSATTDDDSATTTSRQAPSQHESSPATTSAQEKEQSSPLATTTRTIKRQTPPRVALFWILHHNVASDTEMAILANVCQQWRGWIVDYLMRQTVGQSSLHDEDDQLQATTFPPQTCTSRKLLLPSMMRAFVATAMRRRQQPDPASCAVMAEAHHVRDDDDDDNDDRYCIAWFAAEGIQQLAWTQVLREDEALERMLFMALDTSASSRDLTNSVLETNHSEFESDTNTNHTNNHNNNSHHNPTDGEPKPITVTAAPPAAAATPKTLQPPQQQPAVSKTDAVMTTTTEMNQPVTLQWQPKEGSSIVLSNEWRGYRKPWQVLRPFGYTLASVQLLFSTLREHNKEASGVDYDDEHHHDEDAEEDSYSRATFAVRGVTVARPESYCLCMDRIHEATGADNQARLQRLNDRMELRRIVLPRVLHRPQKPSAVQFLNADKSSAVTLLTPALACGTLKEPFTVFVVGIATEDGCFLSGLRHRFEIGHLYPKDQLAELTDSSAICLFTEMWSPDNNNNPHTKNEGSGTRHERDDREDEDEWDVLDTGDDDARDGPSQCTCVFDGVTEKLVLLEDEDEPPGRLVRGHIGPGAWHCYTIVVNGVHSVIRIDGVEEPMELHQHLEAPAFLDGLTLGSDHCFGTSLCCGQGSPGEGEGALAEVALFKGRMDISDLTRLESHFMHKHGIPRQLATAWNDDDLYRQARAMFQVAGNPLQRNVPLRYFTTSPNVAWQVYNAVDQKYSRRERIGARNDDSSSDW